MLLSSVRDVARRAAGWATIAIAVVVVAFVAAGGTDDRLDVSAGPVHIPMTRSTGDVVARGPVRVDGIVHGSVIALERDAIIAKRIADAYYDKYYDQDIYGAEDLNDNGEWIYTRKYGYVWRPFRSSISSYANWSPYRYGHWRWTRT